MLGENVKYIPMSEGVKNLPTLLNLVTDGKSLIESGSNANIYVEDSHFSESGDQMSIKAMVLRRRLAIEAEQEGDK